MSRIGYEFQAGRAILAHDLGLGVKLLPAAHAFGALIGLGIGLGRIATPQRTLYTG